jgi:hypothetical protein
MTPAVRFSVKCLERRIAYRSGKRYAFGAWSISWRADENVLLPGAGDPAPLGAERVRPVKSRPGQISDPEVQVETAPANT